MNQVRFQAENATIAVAWNLFGQISRVDLWFSSADDDAPDWVQRGGFAGSLSAAPQPVVELVSSLKGYFERGTPVEAIPQDWLDSAEWTAFQRDVYTAITQIPHGETRTYGWVASRVGKPSASRAVGQALKKNPLPILIPCHRVVATASLGGFLGKVDEGDPEIHLKNRLLSIEHDYLNPVFPFLHSAAMSSGLLHVTTPASGGWAYCS